MEVENFMIRDERNLDTIPVGSLGIIALKSCENLGAKVDKYLDVYKRQTIYF